MPAPALPTAGERRRANAAASLSLDCSSERGQAWGWALPAWSLTAPSQTSGCHGFHVLIGFAKGEGQRQCLS